MIRVESQPTNEIMSGPLGDGYKMIDQIAIQNFRCFSSLQIAGLKRINVIVGKNSSGKTAFLESLFMVAGASAPQVAFQLRALRQLGNQIQINADSSAYQALWGDLFHWFDQDKTISIEAIGTQGDSRSLRILYSTSGTQILPFGQQPVGSGFLPQIIFEWKRGDEPPIIIKPKVTGTGLQFEGASVEHFPAIIFAPHAADSPEEIAKRFSELSKSARLSPVTDAWNVGVVFNRKRLNEWVLVSQNRPFMSQISQSYTRSQNGSEQYSTPLCTSVHLVLKGYLPRNYTNESNFVQA